MVHLSRTVCIGLFLACAALISSLSAFGNAPKEEGIAKPEVGSRKEISGYTPFASPPRQSAFNLPLIPWPNNSISYDEIIWPWKDTDGVGQWHSWHVARKSVGNRLESWRGVGKMWVFKSTDGSIQQDFSPDSQNSYAIDIFIRLEKETEAVGILDNLKYFPEVRELRIQSNVPLGNHLASLYYCPYLRTVKIDYPMGGSGSIGRRVGIGKESVKAIATLTELRELSFINISVSDKDLESFKGMPNLLYLDLNNTSVTSKSFQTIATLPRIRYLELHGNNYDQELDEASRDALESLVGRIEYLWENSGDTVRPCTKIHASIQPLFDEIKKNGYRVRQKVEENADSGKE